MHSTVCGSLDEKTLYIVSDEHIHAIDADTGNEKWKYKTKAKYSSNSGPLISHDDTVYTGGCDRFCALDKNGHLKWEFNFPGELNGLNIDYDGAVYIEADKKEGKEICVLNKDGLLKRKFKINTDYKCSPFVDKDGNIYFCESYDGIYSLNNDGSERWHDQKIVPGENSTPIVGHDKTIYIEDGFGIIHALQYISKDEFISELKEDAGIASLQTHKDKIIKGSGTVIIGNTRVPINTLYRSIMT